MAQYITILLIIAILFGVGVAVNIVKFTFWAVVILVGLVIMGLFIESHDVKSEKEKSKSNRNWTIAAFGLGMFLLCAVSGVKISDAITLAVLTLIIVWAITEPKKEVKSIPAPAKTKKIETKNPIKKFFITKDKK